MALIDKTEFVTATHPDDYRSAKNGDYEVQQRVELESKEQLLSKLSSMSIVPEPAESACESNIAFYGAITMVYGEPKLGKSFTVATALKGTGAIFIDIDNNGSELHEHLLENGLNPLHGFEAKPFIDAIMSYQGDDRFIIVVDSFANLADELGCSINGTDDVIKLFKKLREITAKGHALVLVHHVTSNGRERGSNDYASKIQGNAGAIFGRVDVTYSLVDRGWLQLDRSRISNAPKVWRSGDAGWFIGGGSNNVLSQIPS
jgi:hypothetical protein